MSPHPDALPSARTPAVPGPVPRLAVGDGQDAPRLLALAAHRLDDPWLRVRLDELCRLTADALGRPAALVTVLADMAEIVVGEHGSWGVFAAHGGVPSEWSLCLHAPPRCAPYEIFDTLDEVAFAHNPLVLIDGIRSYAAVPILTIEAHPVGVLAVLSDRPGALDRCGLAVLLEAAREASWMLAASRRDL